MLFVPSFWIVFLCLYFFQDIQIGNSFGNFRNTVYNLRPVRKLKFNTFAEDSPCKSKREISNQSMVEAKLFDDIEEHSENVSTVATVKSNEIGKQPNSIAEIKKLLEQLSKLVNDVETSDKNKKRASKAVANEVKPRPRRDRGKPTVRRYRHQKRLHNVSKRRFGPWTEWSACSVTCGKGREIRWRHCVLKDCADVETEMEEKTCQLPSCGPGKFFGLF